MQIVMSIPPALIFCLVLYDMPRTHRYDLLPLMVFESRLPPPASRLQPLITQLAGLRSLLSLCRHMGCRIHEVGVKRSGSKIWLTAASTVRRSSLIPRRGYDCQNLISFFPLLMRGLLYAASSNGTQKQRQDSGTRRNWQPSPEPNSRVV